MAMQPVSLFFATTAIESSWNRAQAALWLVLLAWCAPAAAQDTSVTSARPPAAADTVRPKPPDQKTPDTATTISYGLETAFRTGHSDRGFLISDRPVFQPVVWLSGRGTEFSLWGNIALAAATDGSRPDIVEAELTHKYEWKGLSIGPAARMWFYRDRVSRSTSRSVEAWLYLSRDLGPVALFTNHSVDLLGYPGGYFGEAGVESEGKVSPSIEIGGSLGAGWANSTFNDYWAGVAKSAFNRVNAEGWLTVYVTPHFYIGPHVEFSSIVDRDVRRGDLFSPTYFALRLTTGVEF
jgi:hypothetical protein